MEEDEVVNCRCHHPEGDGMMVQVFRLHDQMEGSTENTIISCSAKSASPGSTEPALGSTLRSRLEIFVFVFVFDTDVQVKSYLLVFVLAESHRQCCYISQLNPAQSLVDLIVRCPRTTLAPSAVTPRLVASLLFTPSTMSGSGLTANSNTIKFEEF